MFERKADLTEETPEKKAFITEFIKLCLVTQKRLGSSNNESTIDAYSRSVGAFMKSHPTECFDKFKSDIPKPQGTGAFSTLYPLFAKTLAAYQAYAKQDPAAAELLMLKFDKLMTNMTMPRTEEDVLTEDKIKKILVEPAPGPVPR